MGRDKDKPHSPSTHQGTGKNPLDASTKPGGKTDIQAPRGADNRQAGADAASGESPGSRAADKDTPESARGTGATSPGSKASPGRG